MKPIGVWMLKGVMACPSTRRALAVVPQFEIFYRLFSLNRLIYPKNAILNSVPIERS